MDGLEIFKGNSKLLCEIACRFHAFPGRSFVASTNLWCSDTLTMPIHVSAGPIDNHEDKVHWTCSFKSNKMTTISTVTLDPLTVRQRTLTPCVDLCFDPKKSFSSFLVVFCTGVAILTRQYEDFVADRPPVDWSNEPTPAFSPEPFHAIDEFLHSQNLLLLPVNQDKEIVVPT